MPNSVFSITRLTDFMPDAPMQLMRAYPWWRIQPVTHHVTPRPPLQSMRLHDVSYLHDGGSGVHNVFSHDRTWFVDGDYRGCGKWQKYLIAPVEWAPTPQSGHIYWNDDTITQIGAPDVIAATQIPFLLSDSLRANIMLDTNGPDVTDVLAASALTHDVAQLYSRARYYRRTTRCTLLHGGQRQRVALAPGVGARCTTLGTR
jgi:hypothetical protein